VLICGYLLSPSDYPRATSHALARLASWRVTNHEPRTTNKFPFTSNPKSGIIPACCPPQAGQADTKPNIEDPPFLWRTQLSMLKPKPIPKYKMANSKLAPLRSTSQIAHLITQCRSRACPPSRLSAEGGFGGSPAATHCQLSRLFYFCRESSTNRPLFCTNEPNFQNTKNQRNLFSHKRLRQISSVSRYQKRTQTNPKRTQSKPISQEPKNQRNLPLHKALRQKSQILPHQNEPKRTQLVAAKPMAKPERTQFFARQALAKPKQTQFIAAEPWRRRNKPNLSRRSLLPTAKPSARLAWPSRIKPKGQNMPISNCQWLSG